MDEKTFMQMYFELIEVYSEKPAIMIFSLIGSFLSVILSAALNHSFWWGVLHFFLGWFYVLYVILMRSKEMFPALQNMFM